MKASGDQVQDLLKSLESEKARALEAVRAKDAAEKQMAEIQVRDAEVEKKLRILERDLDRKTQGTDRLGR
ncbi:MAG: hypothetical protein U1G05_01150 [Kiritimatiellia bacterium]